MIQTINTHFPKKLIGKEIKQKSDYVIRKHKNGESSYILLALFFSNKLRTDMDISFDIA